MLVTWAPRKILLLIRIQWEGKLHDTKLSLLGSHPLNYSGNLIKLPWLKNIKVQNAK